jgi:hypothetical protein
VRPEGKVANIKNVVFWDVTSCGSCKNRSFVGTCTSFIRVTRIGELGTALAVTSNRSTLRTKCERKLERNARLRMRRGVGVAGSAVGL